MFSWHRDDYVVAGAVSVLAGLLVRQVVVAVVAFVVSLVVIQLGRGLWHGRREYLLLFARRYEKRRVYRMLDADVRYRPLRMRSR